MFCYEEAFNILKHQMKENRSFKIHALVFIYYVLKAKLCWKRKVTILNAESNQIKKKDYLVEEEGK